MSLYADVDQHSLTPTLVALRKHATANNAELWRVAPEVLAAVAALVADPNQPIHHRFLEAAPSVGFSPEMVGEALTIALKPLSAEALKHHRDRCLPANGMLRCPELIFHVLAGNLFVSGIESITTAMLAGAASLVRCSSADLVYPALWQKAVHQVFPLWGDAIHVTHWPTENAESTAAACSASDAVIAFGSDDSVAAVRALTPIRVPFIPHGTKVSFALVSAEALRENPADIAARLAYDFSVYDQQGCLSPRAAFIEACDSGTLSRFRETFVSEMRSLEQQLPPGPKDLAQSAALARERNEAMIETALDETTELWSTAGDRFVATVRPIAMYQPGSVNRFADLRVFRDIAELQAALAPYRGIISTLGVTGTAGEWRAIADDLRVDRICSLGEMQKPPLGWTHDGRQPLADLLQFTTDET
ncbi:MAG: acyl-CoA reductase [Candidatus Sumerlaeaceae bacterium]